MKNIFLSVVVVATLVAAGVGGTLADFSDIEMSEDNFFSTGSLDLAVSDYLGKEYNGETVPAIYEQSDAWPCCDKSRFFDLENHGQGAQIEPEVYVHFKNFDCYWVQPKDLSVIWVDDAGNVVDEPDNAPGAGKAQGNLPDFPKPLTEPEYVAECGGIAGEDVNGNPVTVPGLGLCYGETCELPEHIGVLMWVAGPWPHEDKPETAAKVPAAAWTLVTLPDPNHDGVTKLNELECEQINLGELPCNEGIWVHISLHLQDIDEDDLGLHCFDENIAAEAKWDHWPTNAIQKDGVDFDIAFELLQQ